LMLRNIRITKRIAIAFGVLVSLFIIAALVGYWSLNLVEQRMTDIIRRDARIAVEFAAMVAKAMTLHGYEKDIVLGDGNLDNVNESFAKWSDVFSQLKKSMAVLDEYMSEPEKN